MDKQKQDKLWNELSEESKNILLKKYKSHADLAENDIDEESRSCERSLKWEYESLFGTHNLNPEQIKTWEDVAIHKSEIWDEIHKVISTISGCSRIGNKLLNKLIATIQIQKLIDLGYGGMVSEEEWKDNKTSKYCIERTDNELVYAEYSTIYYFIAFHTSEQRKEFMSHESNKNLVKQYYLM